MPKNFHNRLKKIIKESLGDLSWIQNSKSNFNPKFDFDGKEYWVDVSKIDGEGRIKIVNYIKKTIPSYEEFAGDELADISSSLNKKGIIIHCGSDMTDFEPNEGLICVSFSSYEDDYEIDNQYADISKSIYIDGREVIEFINLTNDEEELDESLEWSDKDEPFDEKDKSFENDPSWKDDEDWELNPERSYWKQGDAGGSGGGDMNESDDLDWIKDVKPSWLKVGQKFTNTYNLDISRRYEPKDKVQVGAMTFEIYDINHKHGEPHLRFTHNDVMEKPNWESKKEVNISQNYGGTPFTQAKHNIDNGFWIPLTDCEFIESTHPNLVGKTKSDGSPYGHTYCKPITTHSINIHESNDIDWIKNVEPDPLTASPDISFRDDDEMYDTLDQLGHDSTNMTEMTMAKLATNYGYRWSEDHEGWYHRDEVADFMGGNFPKGVRRGIDESDELDWIKDVKSRLPLRVGTCLTFKHSKEEEEWVEDEYGNMIDHGKMNWHITSKFIDVYNDDKPTFSMVATDRMGESRQIFMEVEKVKELYEEGVYEPCKKQPYLKRVMKEESDELQWIKDVPDTIPPIERRNKISIKDFLVDIMKGDVDLLHHFISEDTIGPTTEYMRTGNGGEGFTPEDWDNFGYDEWSNDGHWVDNHEWREDPQIWQSEIRESMELTNGIWKMVEWDTLDYDLEQGSHTDRMVFKRKSDGAYFALNFSGSHYDGIDSWNEEIYQVFPRKITKFIYESKLIKRIIKEEVDAEL